MDVARKNQQIANSFYNLGLEKARIRDLSGAAECLKKSLRISTSTRSTPEICWG